MSTMVKKSFMLTNEINIIIKYIETFANGNKFYPGNTYHGKQPIVQ